MRACVRVHHALVFQCCALHNQLRLNSMNRKKLQEELSTAKELVAQVKVGICEVVKMACSYIALLVQVQMSV